MESKPFWYFDADTKANAGLAADAKYALLPASAEDKAKVTQFYCNAPVSGYELSAVQVIYNPRFNRAFSLELDRLQEKHDQPAFAPQWHAMAGRDQRTQVIAHWEALTQPYTDDHYPAVKLLPVWHGTRPEYLDGIFRVGYSNLSYTDDGFFGRGLYSAYEAEYAYRVYGQGALMVNWVASFSVLPVIEGDMALLRGKGNYGNYDAHFVPVVPHNAKDPQETVYVPCGANQKARYHEMVVFQTSACLPRYLVQLQKTLLKAPVTVKTPTPPSATPLTWQAVFAQAAEVVLDEETQMLQLYFPVPPHGYWTLWQERITAIYEQLKATTERLEQWKTPDDQIQILRVKATPEQWNDYQTVKPKLALKPIDLTQCILIHDYPSKASYGVFFLPNPHEKAYQKLVTALQMGAKKQIAGLLQTHLPLLPYRDDKHNSFLHLLAQTNATEHVDRFLHWGFQLTDRNHYGDLALHYACGAENKTQDPQGTMAAALISLGSPVDATNKQGQTPLMVAARCGHMAAVRVLLEAGAEVTRVDLHGQTACQLAQSSGLPPKEKADLVALLQGKGVKAADNCRIS